MGVKAPLKRTINFFNQKKNQMLFEYQFAIWFANSMSFYHLNTGVVQYNGELQYSDGDCISCLWNLKQKLVTLNVAFQHKTVWDKIKRPFLMPHLIDKIDPQL